MLPMRDAGQDDFFEVGEDRLHRFGALWWTRWNPRGYFAGRRPGPNRPFAERVAIRRAPLGSRHRPAPELLVVQNAPPFS
jgi:hypothetical protein